MSLQTWQEADFSEGVLLLDATHINVIAPSEPCAFHRRSKSTTQHFLALLSRVLADTRIATMWLRPSLFLRRGLEVLLRTRRRKERGWWSLSCMFTSSGGRAQNLRNAVFWILRIAPCARAPARAPNCIRPQLFLSAWTLRVHDFSTLPDDLTQEFTSARQETHKSCSRLAISRCIEQTNTNDTCLLTRKSQSNWQLYPTQRSDRSLHP